MNCRAVADDLTRLVDKADPEVVFLCGQVRSRADVIAELPERVADGYRNYMPEPARAASTRKRFAS